MVLRKFNMDHFIHIVQKTNIRIDAIFQSGLVTSRSKSTFKGCQNTFSDFLDSMIAGSKMGGPIDVDRNEIAVHQLWGEVSGIIVAVNSCMLPFLKLFGIVEGNGLSSFATNFNSPSDLSYAVK